MELFNEFYNCEFQCLLNLFAMNRPFTVSDVEREARSAYVDSIYGRYDEVLRRWEKECGVIEQAEDGAYSVRKNLFPFAAPLNSLEAEMLADIARSHEAESLLSDTLRERLQDMDNGSYICVNRMQTLGKQAQLSSEDAEKLRTILRAIYEHKRIAYCYRTNASQKENEAQVIPFRLEHSAFDGRWWLISYMEDEKRTVKSRLENLRSIRILGLHGVEEQIIRDAIMAHLVETPITLKITGEKPGKVRNVLERCSIAFENMQDIGGRQLGETEFELKFRYFDWDESVVVRKILMLGEYVTVLEPKPVVDRVVAELKAAIAQCYAT